MSPSTQAKAEVERCQTMVDTIVKNRPAVILTESRGPRSRETDDPWLRRMRRTPVEALDACLPQLRAMIGDYTIPGDIMIRPVDLYVSSGHRQAGIVLVGDAFASPCPGSGTGTSQVFTDVTQLCNVHIPNWLATSGMDVSKICQFYDDPVKLKCDAWAEDQAHTLRAVTLENSLF